MSEGSDSNEHELLPWLVPDRTISPTDQPDGLPPEFGKLLQLYSRVVRHHLRQVFPNALRGKVSLSDVLQDTCLRAIQAFPQFNGTNHGHFFCWLLSIGRNTLTNTIDHYLAAKRSIFKEISTFHLGVEEPVDLATGSKAYMKRETREALLRAIRDLPEDEQDIVTRHCDGNSFTKIAIALGLTRGQVYRTWFLALARLEEQLEAVGVAP